MEAKEKEKWIEKVGNGNGVTNGAWNWKQLNNPGQPQPSTSNNTPIRPNSNQKVNAPATEPPGIGSKSDAMDVDAVENQVGGMGPPLNRPNAFITIDGSHDSSSNSQSKSNDVPDQSPTPIGTTPSNKTNLGSLSTSSRLAEALELTPRTSTANGIPSSSRSEVDNGGTNSGPSASNSNESTGTSARPQGNLSASSSGNDLDSTMSNVQREMEKAAQEKDENSTMNQVGPKSLIGDTDATLSRAALLKERASLASDKRYLKQRLFDAEAQLVRFESELRALRPSLLSRGSLYDGAKAAGRLDAIAIRALITPSPYAQVYLNTSLSEELNGTGSVVGERGGPSSSLKEAASQEFAAVSNQSRATEQDRRRKRPTVLMGDAESEHLLLAAKRLRELKASREEAEAKTKSENRQKYKEKRELREREERDRIGDGLDPFYPHSEREDSIEIEGIGLQNPIPSWTSGSTNLSQIPPSRSTPVDFSGRAGSSSVFASPHSHASAPNSASKASGSRKGSTNRASGDRPRTPPRDKSGLPGSPLKRGGSPIATSSNFVSGPRTPGALHSRAFPTPGTTPGSAMDDLLHAAQTVLTPTGAVVSRGEVGGAENETYYSNARVEDTNANGAGLRSPLGGRVDSSPKKDHVLTPGRREAALSMSRMTGGPSGYVSDENLDSSSRKRRRTATDIGDLDGGSFLASNGSLGMDNLQGAGTAGGSTVRTRPRSGTDVNAFEPSNSNPFAFNPSVQATSGTLPAPSSPFAHSNGVRGIGIDMPPQVTGGLPIGLMGSSLSALDLLADQAHAAASQNPSQSSENSRSRSHTDEEIGNLDSEDSEEIEEEGEGEGDESLVVEEDPDRTTTRTSRSKTANATKSVDEKTESKPKVVKKGKANGNKGKGKGKEKATPGKDSSTDGKSVRQSTRRKRESTDAENEVDVKPKAKRERTASSTTTTTAKPKTKSKSVDSNPPTAAKAPTTKPSSVKPPTAKTPAASKTPSVKTSSPPIPAKKAKTAHSRSSSASTPIEPSTEPTKEATASTSASTTTPTTTTAADATSTPQHAPYQGFFGNSVKIEPDRTNMSAQQRGAEKRVPYIRWTEDEDRKLKVAVQQYGQR